MKNVLIKVKKVRGFCSANHKVGDEWMINDINTPNNLCIHAFYVLYPWIQIIRMEGKIPWSKDGEIDVPCIDYENSVLFTLKEVPDEKWYWN